MSTFLVKCRPFLDEFAKEYDARQNTEQNTEQDTKQDTDFGDSALDLIAQTYNEYRHQSSTYYVYFLIKDSVIKGRGGNLTFAQFLRSIFYIGKGTGMRVFQHLKDALEQKYFGQTYPDRDSDLDSEPESTVPAHDRAKRAFDEEKDDGDEDVGNENIVTLQEDEAATPEEQKSKINNILKEWEHGYGIHCYKVTMDVLSAEAFTLEAIAIDGYGWFNSCLFYINLSSLGNLKHGGSLTNLVRGHYGSQNPTFGEWFNSKTEPGQPTPVEQIAATYFRNAYQAFINQRHRPVYSHDVKYMKI